MMVNRAILLGSLALLASQTFGQSGTPAGHPRPVQKPEFAPVPYLGPRVSSTAPLTTQATEPFAKLANFTVDVSNRQHVRSFFNSIFLAPERTPMSFGGDVASCSPGTTASLFKDAVRLRINWFREMAGVPDVISFRDSYSGDAQEAALIMAANRTLTHFPSPSLICYSAAGDTGAQNSNLALGSMGWDSIQGYMDDNGANNSFVGHRRWLLHPPIQEMGTGDLPAGETTLAANAVWVFDDNVFGSAATRDGYVAWPPPGHVPYDVVPARWSFGLDGADFSGASVTMTSGGTSVDVVLEPLQNGAGLNALVWVPMGLDPNSQDAGWPNPGSDTVYTVSLSNVVVGGGAESYSYDVSIFDPATSHPGDVVQSIAGPTAGEVGTAERYVFAEVPFAEENAFRSGTLTGFTAVEGAETGTSNITDGTDPDYPLVTSALAAAGSSSFQLAHPNARDQFFVWERQLLLSAASVLEFSSLLGFASSAQVAKAQVSLDDGQSWTDVYSQAGSNGAGESSFTQRSVALGAFADRVVKVRFAYELEGFSFYPQSDPGVGFFVDQIRVRNAQELTDIEAVNLGKATSFSFTPASTGEHLLQAQFFGWSGFAGSAWGPPLKVAAAAAAGGSTAIAASLLPASRSVFETTATAFATIVNGGGVTALGCRIVPQTNTATTYRYQTTDPASNALTGDPDTPVDIPPGQAQTFALFLAPEGTFAPTDVRFSFDCANTAPAPVTPGLNSLLLSSAAEPVPDIIALAAAVGEIGGTVDIPGATGTGVFAVATINAGAAGSVTVSAGAPPGLGITVNVCETDPGSGACISALGPSVTTSVSEGGAQTFGFFVTGSELVPFEPGENRVVVTFVDGDGVTRGATSVAVRTN